MKKHKYVHDAETARKIFDDFMSQGLPVFDSKGNELILQEDEEFRQCYDAGDSVRKVLPISWFISNHGNLISIYHGKAEWLLKDQNDKARDTYHFILNNKIKIISSYALVGLVFGSKRFGKAEELLKEETVYSFGNYGKEENVQTHHIKNKKDYPEQINDPENLEFMTVRAHRLCHEIPAEDATMQEKQKFMKKFGEICEKESPDSIVIAVRDKDGSCELIQTQAIKMKKELYDFVQAYMENFKKSLEYIMSLD